MTGVGVVDVVVVVVAVATGVFVDVVVDGAVVAAKMFTEISLQLPAITLKGLLYDHVTR